jgi:hypothetical protein
VVETSNTNGFNLVNRALNHWVFIKSEFKRTDFIALDSHNRTIFESIQKKETVVQCWEWGVRQPIYYFLKFSAQETQQGSRNRLLRGIFLMPKFGELYVGELDIRELDIGELDIGELDIGEWPCAKHLREHARWGDERSNRTDMLQTTQSVKEKSAKMRPENTVKLGRFANIFANFAIFGLRCENLTQRANEMKMGGGFFGTVVVVEGEGTEFDTLWATKTERIS